MRIIKEKQIRKIYVEKKIDQIVHQLIKSVGLKQSNFDNSLPNKTPVNLCTVTGRTRSVIKFVKLSRHMFRKYSDNGYIEGVKRSTW